MEKIDAQQRTESVYREYESRKGAERNDLLRNPQVTFQALAHVRAYVEALRRMDFDPADAEALDVGCGDGGWQTPIFYQIGMPPQKLHGVDIRPALVETARARYPNSDFRCADAQRLPFDDGRFSLVTESMIFLQILDEAMAKSIAGEMLRVLKPGGHVLLIDWRYSMPGSDKYRAMSARRIRELFRVGTETEMIAGIPGPLVPPAGRFLSRRLPSLYFLFSRLFPFAVGQKATILRKKPACPIQ